MVEENRRRGQHEPEFELFDTGIFDEDRYFDVIVEYAKADTDDILVRVTAVNRGPDFATLTLLPQLWFRNTWSWGNDTSKPRLHAADGCSVQASHSTLGEYRLYFDGDAELAFTQNETNARRLFGGDQPGQFKDAFHDYVVHGDATAVNGDREGTKVAGIYRMGLAPGESQTIRARLTRVRLKAPFVDFDQTFNSRIGEADEFYRDLQKDVASDDLRHVQRQAFAGMLWSKQYYEYDVPRWLNGDSSQPRPPDGRRFGRNSDWSHLNNADVLSMPDKWEYPWYAAWDLAFHCVSLALVDPDFAKSQLVHLTREWYMHPNGQLPAYEWAFGDVNPPVHAWAAWRVYEIERDKTGRGDTAFLERVFHKLSLNFTWWVNRKDAGGRNIFQGGFLGLDNIGVFDRSAPLPTGGFINQSDGTSWMAMYSLNLMRIALELAQTNRVYEDVATKFFEHFLYIAKAMNNIGDQGIGLWDEQDEFYYDVLNLPDGQMLPMRLRTMVGLIPLFAVEVLEPEILENTPDFARRLDWFLEYRPDLAGLVSRWEEPGRGERRLLSLLRGHRMKCLLRRMLDETEFLSDYGIRSVSKVHEARPYEFWCREQCFSVRYQPAESESGLFGGNSNWRGPIWFPVNFLLVESLRRFHGYYGDEFRVECPEGSGRFLSLGEAADEISRRLTRIFLPDAHGERPVFGHADKLRTDPHFRDHLLFYEYFHGDTGRGVGASHQTGWTGLVVNLAQPNTNGAMARSEQGDRNEHAVAIS